MVSNLCLFGVFAVITYVRCRSGVFINVVVVFFIVDAVVRRPNFWQVVFVSKLLVSHQIIVWAKCASQSCVV